MPSFPGIGNPKWIRNTLALEKLRREFTGVAANKRVRGVRKRYRTGENPFRQPLKRMQPGPRKDHEECLSEKNLIRALQIVELIRKMNDPSKTYFIQDMMVRTLIAMALPLIVGKKLAVKNMPRYLKLLGVKSTSVQVQIIQPRQSGKTIMMCILMCVLMCCCPGSEIVCIAVSKVQSTKILTTMRGFYEQLPAEFKKRVIISNAENMVVEHRPGVFTKISCRSQIIDACRGMTPDFVCIDEFEFLKAMFYNYVVIPLFAVEGRIMATISTPGAPESAMTAFRRRAIIQQGRGNNFVRVYDFAMICELCRAKDIADMCAHGFWMLPKWKSVYNITQLANVYDKDQREIYVQEIYGESLAPSNRLFGERACDTAFTLDNKIVLAPNHDKNFIYVGMYVHLHLHLDICAN